MGKLDELKQKYRYAFFVLSQFMPPPPTQISKRELNKLAKKRFGMWARLPPSTRSDYIMRLVDFGFFRADCIFPQFISMSPDGEGVKPAVAAEFADLDIAADNALPNGDQEDSLPLEEDE